MTATSEPNGVAGGRRRRPGRPPGSGNSRDAVLATARRIFAERGYSGASLRLIAAEAGVDPGMVRHFFTDKEGLFRAALEFPFHPSEVIPRLLEPGVDGLGERLVHLFLDIWEAEHQPMITLLRGATGHERSATMLREFITEAFVARLAAILRHPDPEFRATLVGSQLIGLAFVRYIIRAEPLASVPRETLVATIGPTMQRYLTGDL